MSPYRSSAGPSVVTMVESVGVPRPNSGAGHRVGGPKRVLRFCCTGLKNAERNAELKGLDSESLVTEPIPVNKAPKTQLKVTGFPGGSPHT